MSEIADIQSEKVRRSRCGEPVEPGRSPRSVPVRETYQEEPKRRGATATEDGYRPAMPVKRANADEEEERAEDLRDERATPSTNTA